MSSTLTAVAVPLGVALVSCVLLLILRSVALRILHKSMGGREPKSSIIEELVVDSLSTPSIYWCIAIGLYVGMAVSRIPGPYVFYFSRAIQVLVTLSISIAAANMAVRLFKTQVQRLSIPIPATGLVSGVLKGTIVGIGLIIILGLLGISIAPLLTALGVGGLAVALALQDTLADLFAGFHILVEKALRVGDFIRLETGQEGHVEDITWRTTRIRTLANSIVVVPNKKLAQSVVTNYDLPEKKIGSSFIVRIDQSEDPDRVEAVIRQEAQKAVAEVEGLVEGQQTAVSFNIGDNSIDFTLAYQVKHFVDQFAVQNALKKRIFMRLRAESIQVPLPTRIVYIRDERNEGRPDTSV